MASYLTDANDPDVLSIPGGNFNCEFYFSVNNNTGNPFFYAELYKYDGTTFTLLGSNVGVPEYINQGTIIRTDSEEIQVGSKLQVITPEGVMDVPVEVTEMVIMVNEMPMKIYIENGIVKGIEPEEVEEAPVMEEMASNNNQEFEAKFAELNERLSKLEAALGLATCLQDGLPILMLL